MTTFDQILVRHRRLEAERKKIARSARESLAAFHAGKLNPLSVQAIIRKLRKFKI